ncbi:hypothetical protein OS493_031156 [Desmophyllum pertusum]|uniref:SAM domain-containing protein n=1 Tax=Desmophyllum pertusum TaxID=174260 RepID=A0A9X0D8H4_9CNID|nr:hypothetical protein OS493_031156 [Desmophyllum pertusum]
MAESTAESSLMESLNEVIDYLEFELKLKDVVESFRSEKVDKAAVAVMCDQQLADLGIIAAGDRAKLRAFCQGKENVTKDEKRAEMKRKLTDILEASKSRSLSQKSVNTATGVSRKSVKTPASGKKTTLKFELRPEGPSREGECATLDISRKASANDCLFELKNTFFPNGKSLVGNADDMEFVLADFQLQKISMSADFSPERYKAENRLQSPRLFLFSRDKGLSSEESDNEDLMKSPFDSSSPSDTLINSRVADAVKDDPVSITSKEAKSSERSAEESEQANEGSSLGRTPSEEDVSEHSTDGLIGTSDERKELMDHINAEYEASLAVDKEKELQKEANVRREALRVSRENRVLHEPAAQKPRVIVSVRHPFLGAIKRAFPSDCTFNSIV